MSHHTSPKTTVKHACSTESNLLSYICIYLETPLICRFVIFTSDEAKFSKIQIFSQFWQTICLEYVLQSNFWLCPFMSIHCSGRASDVQNLHLQCYRQTLDLWLALLRMQPFHDVRKSHIRSMLSCCMFHLQMYSSPFYTIHPTLRHANMLCLAWPLHSLTLYRAPR